MDCHLTSGENDIGAIPTFVPHATGTDQVRSPSAQSPSNSASVIGWRSIP